MSFLGATALVLLLIALIVIVHQQSQIREYKAKYRAALKHIPTDEWTNFTLDREQETRNTHRDTDR